MRYHIDADVSIDQNDPVRFMVRKHSRTWGWRDVFGPATHEECVDWCQDAIYADRNFVMEGR